MVGLLFFLHLNNILYERPHNQLHFLIKSHRIFDVYLPQSQKIANNLIEIWNVKATCCSQKYQKEFFKTEFFACQNGKIESKLILSNIKKWNEIREEEKGIRRQISFFCGMFCKWIKIIFVVFLNFNMFLSVPHSDMMNKRWVKVVQGVRTYIIFLKSLKSNNFFEI